jgi:hypothetical protein
MFFAALALAASNFQSALVLLNRPLSDHGVFRTIGARNVVLRVGCP